MLFLWYNVSKRDEKEEYAFVGLQRGGGWCKPLIRKAEVTLERCKGRAEIFCSVVCNGAHRYGKRVCFAVGKMKSGGTACSHVLIRTGGFFYFVTGRFKIQEVCYGSVQRAAQNLRAERV